MYQIAFMMAKPEKFWPSHATALRHLLGLRITFNPTCEPREVEAFVKELGGQATRMSMSGGSCRWDIGIPLPGFEEALSDGSAARILTDTLDRLAAGIAGLVAPLIGAGSPS